MEKIFHDGMGENINKINEEVELSNKKIFLFGYCRASLDLVDFLDSYGLRVIAILDNSDIKQGLVYKSAVVIYPKEIFDLVENNSSTDSIVLITSRFYAPMLQQLRELGYEGPIRKVIDYNTYAEYSLSEDTIARMRAREKHGEELLDTLKVYYGNLFMVFCPFDALGDVYFCMSYLPAFLAERYIYEYVICVPSDRCAAVARLFGAVNIEVMEQKELDAAIQAVIYRQDDNCFIAHQDRPYVVNLHKALQIKCIPLEMIYRCGVFGLPMNTKPIEPSCWTRWNGIESIEKGNAVILSPYAKSVTALDKKIWMDIIEDFKEKGYQLYTNISEDEKPLPETAGLVARLSEMKSIVEKAGIFIGIRSGLCDVIRTASCTKIALYPDYYYSDTKWKAIEMYSIDGFENITVKEGDSWEKIKRKVMVQK